MTTKAGTRFDPDLEKRLTEEAEAGFDPAPLTRRHAGSDVVRDAICRFLEAS